MGAEGPHARQGVWGRRVPQRGTGAAPRWGSRGQGPLKQNECKVFPPAEIASP